MGNGTSSQSVIVRAPGKLNLCFRVGALQDDGYHDVASLYQAVSLYEEVTASNSDQFSVQFGGPVDCADLATDDNNIAIRAAKLLARETGYQRGVSLSIIKQVPIAGGMGGGSADAAATLVACDELWQTGLGRAGLLPLAAQLGADVPFALEGGTAIGVGRGDRLSHALAKGEYHWVLAFAQEGLSTPAVYYELDRHRERNQADLPPAPESVMVDAASLQAVRAGDAVALAEAMQNDLQAAALKLRPELGDTLEFGESRGALAAIVSGSGPTCAFLMPDALTASELLSAFKRNGSSAVMATGPVPGAHVVERR